MVVIDYTQGRQVLYVPTHANGNTAHPDCEAGFIMSSKIGNDIIYVRYWNKDLLSLRTVANSEGTANHDLVLMDSVPQEQVLNAIEEIEDVV